MLKSFVLALAVVNCAVAADLVVAADGTGQFKTLQAAVDRAPPHTVIHVKPGVYKERVVVPPEKTFLTLRGDDPLKTVITFDTHAGSPGPDGRPLITFGTPTVFIQANDFTAENITFENSAGRHGQALALTIMSDRGVFRNCRFLGYQDTLLAQAGRQYFDHCYIAGAVDFIFGGSTAYFDHCEIHVTANGYITAANTPKDQRFGYVFSHTKITGEPNVLAYLGRPWRPYAATVFLDSEMSSVIRPVGWNNWNDPAKEKTARYGEYPVSDQGRVSWARALKANEAKTYTIENVLGGIDGWDPRTGTVKRSVRVVTGSGKPGPLYMDIALIATTDSGFAHSTDGLHWSALKAPDSHGGSLAEGPDGVFRLVWAADKLLNFSASNDLLQWSEPKRIDIMAKQRALNLASPHIFYDDSNRNYIVTWSSTIAANAIQSFQEEIENNPRIWYATTRDFESFSDPQLLFDPNYSVRDGVLIRIGGLFGLVHNDNTRPMQSLRVAIANSPRGPWGPSSETFTAKFTDSPSVVPFDSKWWVYYSTGLVTTKDFWTFLDESAYVSLPDGLPLRSVTVAFTKMVSSRK